MRLRRLFLIAGTALALLFCTTLLFGGSGYNARCTDEKCGYEGRINFGGGFTFNQVTGYCAQCKQFVYVSWPNGSQTQTINIGEEPPAKPIPPKPLGTIWDPATGKTGTLYACPKCKGPFLAVNEGEMKCCPKCNKPTLKMDLLLEYD